MTKGDSQNADNFYLSSRSCRATKPALPYFSAFMAAKKRPWSKEDPDGNIIASVAENKLTSDLVQKKFSQLGSEFAKDLLCYDNMKGIQPLREAFCELLTSTFMEGVNLRPENLCISAGCGAILDNLFFCIGAAGSSVLVPAPYYPAFDNDLEVKGDVRTIPVHFDLDSDLLPQLDAATTAAAADGRPVVALLITCPDNPTGTIYPDHVLQQMLYWSLSRRVHLVSDEVYGNSVFADGVSFTSVEVLARRLEQSARESASDILDLDPNTTGSLTGGEFESGSGSASEWSKVALSKGEVLDLLPKLVHVVFGMSKDFCASGLRVGVLHTRNSRLLQALDNLSYFCAVSNVAQHALAAMLTDAEWLRDYLTENRRRLAKSYGVLEAALTSCGIPFIPSVAAMFTWLDLSRALSDPKSWDAEAELWRELTERKGVLLTPGKTCHSAKPGCFRFCWASVDPDSIPEAVRRIHEVYTARVSSAAAP